MEPLPLAPSSGPQMSTRGLKTRSQPSLDAKERFCKNACFPQGKQRVFEGRVAKNIPLFRSEAATASHLDGNKLTESLGNTPSALNEKQKKKRVFSFFFSLLSFLCSLPSALEAARGPPRGRDGREKGRPPSGGLIWGPLAASFGVSFLFFLLSSLFALLSSLFSLLSSPCRRGLARPRSPLIPLLSSERVSERPSE